VVVINHHKCLYNPYVMITAMINKKEITISAIEIGPMEDFKDK